jgi:2-oxoglutarate dehydrogenase E1 component
MRRNYRKPLVVASPKKLLKFAKANSDFEDFGENKSFHEIFPDNSKTLVSADKVKKVILCSG